MRQAIKRTSLAVVAGIFSVNLAVAADLPKTHVKVVGAPSTVRHLVEPEKKYWLETVPKASEGQITSDYNNANIMGIKDFQMLRLLKLGVTDFATESISKMSGDDPVFEGCDLAGLALSLDTARKLCAAWRPAMQRSMEKNFNTKLLGLGVNPPQVFWCRESLKGLADLKGRKIRVFNKSMVDFVTAAGGTPINMAFAEVVPALQRGVIDCAVTGTTSGNSAGWPEVTTHLYPMYLGWAIMMHAVNLNSWKRFGPEVQAFFTETFPAFEDNMWDTIAQSAAEADNCNTGKDPCTYGKKANMTIVPISDSDKALHKEVMESLVLLNWGKRCGKACAKEWNETAGKVVGMTIPLDKL